MGISHVSLNIIYPDSESETNSFLPFQTGIRAPQPIFYFE
jgi:hypothetical protein